MIKYFEYMTYTDDVINEYARENNFKIIFIACNKFGIYVVFEEI